MKIVLINVIYKNGSTGKIVQQLRDFLVANGHEVLVIYGRGEKNKNAIKCSNFFLTAIDALKTRFCDNAGFNSSLSTKKVIKLIKDFKPDIINLHNLHGYYLNIDYLFKYLANEFVGKIFWTMHDCWGFTGHCSYYTVADCDKWITGCDNCQLIKQYPKSFFLDNSKKNFEKKYNIISNIPADRLTIIAPSMWIANDIKKSKILSKYNVEVIYGGIDSSFFTSELKNKSSSDDINLLACAFFWTDLKGLFDIIELSKKLPNRYKITMIGTIKDSKIKLPPNIRHINTISHQDLINYYLKSDIFINPTHSDTYGLVNAESICCGTPVITYDVCGTKETIKKEEYGIAIDSNVEALKEAILKFKKRHFITDYSLYSFDTMCEKYLKLFKK